MNRYKIILRIANHQQRSIVSITVRSSLKFPEQQNDIELCIAFIPDIHFIFCHEFEYRIG